jgi:hypothetical protein
MMRSKAKQAAKRLHPPGLLERLLDRIRGRDQRLVRAGDDLPLLLLSFPRGADRAGDEIETAYTHVLRSLSPATREPYEALFRVLPALVVVVLRPKNLCGCLGHHHPRGTESRLTRRLAADIGRQVGEIDLAYESLREWRPQPLSRLAAGDGGDLEAVNFQAATLAVLLHELEHLGFPEKSEQEIRLRSNAFYEAAMDELLRGETGAGYGMGSPSSRP